jgi:hypothetical protein
LADRKQKPKIHSLCLTKLHEWFPNQPAFRRGREIQPHVSSSNLLKSRNLPDLCWHRLFGSRSDLYALIRSETFKFRNSRSRLLNEYIPTNGCCRAREALPLKNSAVSCAENSLNRSKSLAASFRWPIRSVPANAST